ncbi:MAG TPA: FtsQ-type POTRA domain-containing protein [Syntrophomonadaceae bacterium]|nr:FtsQ-type POTRA domain-containing protein [Syntrophomonadaceae bacterium]
MKNTSKGVFKFSILLLIGLVCIFLFLHSSIFNITQFKVQGNKLVSEDEILALAGVKKGENIFRVNKILTARSVEVHPMIKKAEIKRQLPSTLLIEVEERRVWAMIPFQGMFLYVDDEGVCIDRHQQSGSAYPIITMDIYPERVNLGQRVNPQAIHLARQVWNLLPEEQRKEISEFHYVNKEKSLILYTLKGTEIRFGREERMEEKVQLVLEVMSLEEKMEQQGEDVLEYVDIRYKGQPVVKIRT